MTAENRGTILGDLSIPPYSSIMSNNDTGTWSNEFVLKNSTIIGKLIDMRREQTEANVRNGPFIKCDFIEELLKRESLNYVTVKLYPSKFVFFKNSPDKMEHFLSLKMDEDEEILDCIDKEEISMSLVALLDRQDWKLMYDYHVILQIQKFLDDEEGRDPVFCKFLLLKPTDKVLRHYIFKKSLTEEDYMEQQAGTEKMKRKLRNKKESEILSELYPVLYLGTDQAALDNLYVQQIYSDLSFMNRKFESQTQSNEFKMEKWILDTERSFTGTLPKDVKGFEFTDSREELFYILASRKINSDNLEINNRILVEFFYFQFSEDSNSNKLLKYEISVTMKNGFFYTSEASIYGIKNGYLYKVGSRKELDSYILAFSEAVSKKFSIRMCIKHKNCLDGKSCLTEIFTCGSSFQDEFHNIEPAVDDCLMTKTIVKPPEFGGDVDENVVIKSIGYFVSAKLAQKDICHLGEFRKGFQAQKKNINPPPSVSTNAEKKTKKNSLQIFRVTTEELWSI